MTAQEVLKALNGEVLSVEEINMVQLTLICDKLGITNEDIFKSLAVYAKTRQAADMLALSFNQLKEDEGYNA